MFRLIEPPTQEQVDSVISAVKNSQSKEITNPDWKQNWKSAVKFSVRVLNHEGIKCEFFETENNQWGVKLLE